MNKAGGKAIGAAPVLVHRARSEGVAWESARLRRARGGWVKWTRAVGTILTGPPTIPHTMGLTVFSCLVSVSS